MPLGDEIAVLDGIDIPNYYATSGVLDASAGANYSGGSSYADGLPLLPSNSGLAGDIPDYYASRDILDASAGANYSGGSSYADGLPLLPSSAGLAGDIGAYAKDVAVPMETLLLQRYLVAIGVSLVPDGAWGKASEDATARFLQNIEGKTFIHNLEKVKKVFSPFARGRMVLVKDPAVLPKIFNMMRDKAQRGEVLAGIPNHYSSINVLDASAGANYSGGSSYADGLPLLPSNAGLADDDLMQYSIAAGVLAPKRNVLDASDGANYSGGSSYADGLPLLPSNAGLAGTYDGCALEDIDKYWGSTMGVSDNAYESKNVLDASSGANYSGGSSYADGLPLLPSNSGLAGLDAVSDKAFMPALRLRPGLRQTFQRVGAKQSLINTKMKMGQLQRIQRTPGISRETYFRVKAALIQCQRELNAKRAMRANVLKMVGLPMMLTPKQRALSVARRAFGARA